MKFLTFSYWTYSGSLIPMAQTGLLLLLGALIILIIIFKVIKNKHKRGLYFKLLSRLEQFCWGNLIIGAFLWFFTYESVRFLSGRFWFLIWGIVILIWIYFIIKTAMNIPELKKQLEKEKEYKKYLP